MLRLKKQRAHDIAKFAEAERQREHEIAFGFLRSIRYQ